MSLQSRFDTYIKTVPSYPLPPKCLAISDVHASGGNHTDPLVGSKMEVGLMDLLYKYWEKGFVLIKVGDWWDVWRAESLTNIYHAHQPLMEMVELNYRDSGRLIQVLGNHERDECSYPGVVILEGYNRRVFIDHGYLEDWINEDGWKIARQLVHAAAELGLDPESSPHPENRDRHMEVQSIRHKLAYDNPDWDFLWGHTHYFESLLNNHNCGTFLNARPEGYLIIEGEFVPLGEGGE